MKLRAIYVDGFGVWRGLRLEGFRDGVNLIYGPNEAGKTTLLEFVRSILYGFGSAWDGFLPPIRPGRAGGWLEVATSDGLFRIQRLLTEDQLEQAASATLLERENGSYFPSRGQNESALRLGQLRILGPDGIGEEGTRLAGWLAGVDEIIYQNIFAIGLRELQQLALLSQTEAARLLYALSAGVDRVSLAQVSKELHQARYRILAPADQSCLLADLLARREKLRRQIQAARQSASQYPQLLAQRDQADQQAHQLQVELAQLQQQMRLVETALAVRDRLQQRAALDAQLAALAPGKPVSAEMLQQFETLQQGIEDLQSQAAQLRLQQAQIREQLAATPINKHIISQSSRIRALIEQLPWLEQLEERLAHLQEEMGLLEAQWAELSQQVGLPEADGLQAMTGGLARTQKGGLWDRLRGPVAQIRQLRRQVQQAQQQADAARQTAQALQEQIEQALADRGYQDLSAALEQTSHQLTALRRRQQIDHQLAQIQRQQADLARQADRLSARQTRPIAEPIAWAVVLVAGAALVVWGALLPGLGIGTWQLGWAAGGVLLAAGSLLGNIFLQHRRRRQLDTCSQQRKMLQRQLAQLQEERQVLDGVIPSGSGSLAERIEILQRELTFLEQLTPLDTRRQTAWQEVQSAETSLHQYQQQLQAALQRWKETLELFGLPANLSPAQASRLQAEADRLADLQQRLQQARHQYDQDQQQWETLRNRIRQLAEELGLHPAHLNPMELVHLMEDRLKMEEATWQRWRQLRWQLRRLGREQRRVRQQLARLLRHRRKLFRQAGLRSEEAFRRQAAQTQQAEQLRHQRQTLQREIEAILAGRFQEEDLAPYLQSDVDLADQQTQLAERIALLTEQLHACHERRGQLAAQLRQMAADGTLAELRLQWDQLEREIAQASRRWQVLALTSQLLDELRQRYQRQYQPETLQEASEYFRRMSGGRYQRVWRPLDKEELWVDLAEGPSLPVDRLSHGTRELLYLSLRLALVAAYARRGVRLPMILDDVMVNFDTGRAKATAELLRDFALQGHQILLFTCHEHIQRLFQHLRVPQATLPDWSQQPLPRVRLEILSEESVLPAQKSRRRKPSFPPQHLEAPLNPFGAEGPGSAGELTEAGAESSESASAQAQSPSEPTEVEPHVAEPTEPEPASSDQIFPSPPASEQSTAPSALDEDFQWYDRLVEDEDGHSELSSPSAQHPNAEAA